MYHWFGRIRLISPVFNWR